MKRCLAGQMDPSILPASRSLPTCLDTTSRLKPSRIGCHIFTKLYFTGKYL